MIEMTSAQYERLMLAALATTADDTAELLMLRATIDEANGVKRYNLAVRYQAVPAAPQPNPPVPYPPTKVIVMEQLRPFTRADVDEALRGIETIPELVSVTPDPQHLVGWTLLDDYDFGGT